MTTKYPRPALHTKTVKVAVQSRHAGALGKAKILTPDQFDRAAKAAKADRMFGERDALLIMLSRFGGLRAKEIATIHLEDLTDAEGKFSGKLEVAKRGAKYGKERTIPLRPEVADALKKYIKAADVKAGPLFYTYRGDPMTSNAVQKQIKATYVACGFQGARSHSGRRYAITTMAQKVNTIGASLEDVRIFAGHADISTTATYIDASPHAVEMVGFL